MECSQGPFKGPVTVLDPLIKFDRFLYIIFTVNHYLFLLLSWLSDKEIIILDPMGLSTTLPQECVDHSIKCLFLIISCLLHLIVWLGIIPVYVWVSCAYLRLLT